MERRESADLGLSSFKGIDAFFQRRLRSIVTLLKPGVSRAPFGHGFDKEFAKFRSVPPRSAPSFRTPGSVLWIAFVAGCLGYTEE